NITNKIEPPLKTSNSIQILNTVDYKWVKSFPGLSPNTIVISVGFALIIAGLIGAFILYGRNRQKKNVQELSSFNDASSSASISTTTPSLISSSNSQNPSNHNSFTLDPTSQKNYNNL
ncbi:10116_t:CDS:2, partial [Entrophospora sp. SA101]